MLDFFQNWKTKILTLIETKTKLVQLEFIERTSNLVSYLIFLLIFILLGFGVFLFIGLGIAEMFSEVIGNYFLGYLCAAGVYLIVGLVLFFLRKNILRFLSNKFIGVLTSQSEEEDDDDDKESV